MCRLHPGLKELSAIGRFEVEEDMFPVLLQKLRIKPSCHIGTNFIATGAGGRPDKGEECGRVRPEFLLHPPYRRSKNP
jgi:hypothetical protein